MTDLDFGPVVLGGNVFGWTVEKDDAFRIFDEFLARGGKSIDTADMYPMWAPGKKGGESEEIIGAWMAARKNRDRVVVATKVAKWPPRAGLAPANLRAALEDSLRRLKTDHVDLYYAHEDDAKVPQAEVMAAFDALVKEGKVRVLGASNFAADRLSSAQKIARDNHLTPFSVAQDHWNLVERDAEKTLVPTLAKEKLRELPYWSLASGFLTGKYRPGKKVESARAGSAGKHLDNPKSMKALAVLDELAAAHGVGVTAVALAWLRAQPVVAAPIASARTVEQLGPLLEAVALTPAEVAKLSETTA